MKTLTLLLSALFVTTLATPKLASLTFASEGGFTLVAQPRPPIRPAPDGITLSSTWTDDDYEKMMKQIGPGAANLRKLIDDKAAAAAEAQADTLQHLFDDVEEFWDARKVADAEEWAEEASAHAGRVEDAVEGNDFAKAGEHLKQLMGVCQTCHAKYRERAPDGTFRMKKVG